MGNQVRLLLMLLGKIEILPMGLIGLLKSNQRILIPYIQLLILLIPVIQHSR